MQQNRLLLGGIERFQNVVQSLPLIGAERQGWGRGEVGRGGEFVEDSFLAGVDEARFTQGVDGAR